MGLLNMSRGSGSPRRAIRSDSRVFTVFAVNFYFSWVLKLFQVLSYRKLIILFLSKILIAFPRVPILSY